MHRTNDGPSTALAQRDETLGDYEARGGLEALRSRKDNDWTVAQLKASGLTGYGGAGFATGVKWEAVAREAADATVVVNADEGEPGTINDRYVIERRPHLLNDEWLVGPRYLSLDSLAPLFEERREGNADQEVPALTAA